MAKITKNSARSTKKAGLKRTVSPGSTRRLTGAAILVRELQRLGVEHIFGYPGGATLPIHDELTKEGMHVVLSGDERCAGHSAQGYARSTGKVGVALVTSGPGATNIVTPLTDAKMDSTPMVAISGQVRSHVIGKDAFQEAPIIAVTSQITKHNYLVRNVEDIAPAINAAFHLASTGRPGPVLVDITKDAQENSIREDEIVRDFRHAGYTARPVLNIEQLGRALDEIQKAKRPIVYAGQGISLSSAEKELRAFAEKTGIPVTLTVMGLGSLPGSHPSCLGMLGMHGSAWCNFAMDEADLVIALGARFDDRVTGNPKEFIKNARVIHVDIDAAEINKNVGAHVAVVGDVKEALKWLNPRVKKHSYNEWWKRINFLRKRFPNHYQDDGSQIKPQYVLETLYDLTRGRAILTTGVGQHQMWAAQFCPVEKTRSFLTSGGAGTMGFGLPAAIGACLGRPGELVVDIDGDGSFDMNINDMRTVADLNLPVKVLILNNKSLGMVSQWQRISYEGRYSVSSFKDEYPNFAQGVQALYGIPGKRITKKAEVRSALKEMISKSGPYLLDVMIPKEEDVFPMVPAGGVVGDVILPKGVKKPGRDKDGRVA